MGHEQSTSALSVAAAIIWEDDAVLACKRDKGTVTGWEFPGGKLEQGESSFDACRREIQEELGCRLSTTWLLDTIEYDYPTFHLSMDCYVCMLVPGQTPTAKEHAELRWVRKEALGTLEWLPADQLLVRLLGEQWDQIFMAEHL